MNHDLTEPGKGKCGLTVKVYNNNVDKALKIFKKKILNDGLLKELRARGSYEKPSVKRRRKRKEARRRLLKALSMRKKLEGY